MEYVRRVEFLKGVVGAAKYIDPIERAAAAQLLSKSASVSTDVGPSVATQIHQKTMAKYNRELRSELFNVDKGSEVRRRPSTTGGDDDLDALLKYNRNMQERIAENMLLMTSSMKEHAVTASAIIRKDVDSLTKSDRLTDSNAAKLHAESIKLKEHTKSTWRWWVWLMVAFVLIVFCFLVPQTWCYS